MPTNVRIFDKKEIENFLASDKIYMEFDWKKKGYCSYNVAHSSMNGNLERCEFPCRCIMSKGKLYIIRNGYKMVSRNGQRCLATSKSLIGIVGAIEIYTKNGELIYVLEEEVK